MERPILFSAPMVRAILAGTKTQTRRIVKGAPDDWSPIGPKVYSPTVIDRHGDEQPGPDEYGAGNEEGDWWIRYPYGKPGARLWVRETWLRDIYTGGFQYFADHPSPNVPKWKPSIHMPRAASRITLEVTGVRVERIQDITHGDVEAEGIACPGAPRPTLMQKAEHCSMYRALWESINGPGSWATNPWVWVVEFRRVT